MGAHHLKSKQNNARLRVYQQICYDLAYKEHDYENIYDKAQVILDEALKRYPIKEFYFNDLLVEIKKRPFHTEITIYGQWDMYSYSIRNTQQNCGYKAMPYSTMDITLTLSYTKFGRLSPTITLKPKQ